MNQFYFFLCKKLFIVIIGQSLFLSFIKSDYLPILFLPHFFPYLELKRDGQNKNIFIMVSVQYLAINDYPLYINSYWNCIKMMHHNFKSSCLNGFLNIIYFMEGQVYNSGILPIFQFPGLDYGYSHPQQIPIMMYLLYVMFKHNCSIYITLFKYNFYLIKQTLFF